MLACGSFVVDGQPAHRSGAARRQIRCAVQLRPCRRDGLEKCLGPRGRSAPSVMKQHGPGIFDFFKRTQGPGMRGAQAGVIPPTPEVPGVTTTPAFELGYEFTGGAPASRGFPEPMVDHFADRLPVPLRRLQPADKQGKDFTHRPPAKPRTLQARQQVRVRVATACEAGGAVKRVLQVGPGAGRVGSAYGAEMAHECKPVSTSGMLPAFDAASTTAIPPVAPRDTPPKRPEQRRHGDRFKVLNDFCDISARLVDTTAQACWLQVYSEERDGRARISHEQIAHKLGVTRVTVSRALKRLEKAGLVEVLKRGGLHKGMSTYRVHGVPAHQAKSLPGITR